MISPAQNNRNETKSVEKTEIEFTISEVHRPENSKFIEQILIEKIASAHRDFYDQKHCHKGKNNEILMVNTGDNGTSKVVTEYLNMYNNINIKNMKEKIDDNFIYSNSPLQKTEKNEKEFENYRKLRGKSGEEYSEKKRKLLKKLKISIIIQIIIIIFQHLFLFQP